MKKTATPVRLLAATVLALMLNHTIPIALAQTVPSHAMLPNVDKRVGDENFNSLSATKKEAIGNLRNRISGLQTEIDPLLKKPSYFHQPKAF